ncbi:MAG: peptide chain release factor N(5)-glutamine methyltransferase [Mariprofundaceae bacterium]|nr:peptide chain release factor N(5)-glutamine methyltransferase [Mariprofundaceae bacterium]
MIAREVLHDAIQYLKKSGFDTPRLDAEVLLMYAWGITATQLFTRALDELPYAVEEHFQAMLQQRHQGQPIAYITGHKEFWSRDFEVSPDVLIPRPETEHLIEQVMQCYPNHDASYDFAEIGTGSGCIAITLACEYPHASILATDISEKALNIARNNAKKHGVLERIDFRQGDVYQAFPKSLPTLDLLVSNPPYLSLQHMDDIAVELTYEPSIALTDQQDGLSLLYKILFDAEHWLKPQAYCVVETGLSGLPDTPKNLVLDYLYHDLAGLLRGGVYHHHMRDSR